MKKHIHIILAATVVAFFSQNIFCMEKSEEIDKMDENRRYYLPQAHHLDPKEFCCKSVDFNTRGTGDGYSKKLPGLGNDHFLFYTLEKIIDPNTTAEDFEENTMERLLFEEHSKNPFITKSHLKHCLNCNCFDEPCRPNCPDLAFSLAKNILLNSEAYWNLFDKNKLTHVNLAYKKRLKPETLAFIAKNFKNISKLNLYDSVGSLHDCDKENPLELFDWGLFQSLEKINLGLSKATDLVVSKIGKLCPKIKKIEMCCCPNFTGEDTQWNFFKSLTFIMTNLPDSVQKKALEQCNGTLIFRDEAIGLGGSHPCGKCNWKHFNTRYFEKE